MDYAIEATGLTKRFGETQALAGVDFAVPAGKILGVLGPNGAGKTTAVRIMATLTTADSGSARINGYDVVEQAREVRASIGLTGQYASVDEDLTGMQNLVLIGQLLDLSSRDARARATELLAWFDLTEAGGRMAKTYSGGMRRRLDLAVSLVGRPAVIFLDEPTTGLDPAKREDMWGVVRTLVADGSTVLLTTQYLDEADALADEITVIDHGRVIAHDTPDGLKRVVGGQTLSVRPTDASRLDEVATMVGEVAGRDPGPDRPGCGPRAGRRRQCVAVGGGPARIRRHHRHRAGTDPAEPRRSVLHPHRPADRRVGRRDRRPRQGGGGMSASVALTSGTQTGLSTRPLQLLRHSLVLARRSLIKTMRTPEALIDVTLQPVIFIALFTYVFGGAIEHGSRHDYLQLLVPGMLAQTIGMAGIALGQNLNADIDKGVFDRFRSLPIGRSVPLIGGVLADIVRYLILFVMLFGFGSLLGFRVSQPEWFHCSRRSVCPWRSGCASAGSRCSSG